MLEQSLSEGFKQEKDRYIAELKSILEKKRAIMKKRLECVQSALRFSVCKKTLSSLFEARQYQLQDLKTDLSKQEEELEKLTRQKEAIDRKMEEVKERDKEMRKYIYTQSGLFHWDWPHSDSENVRREGRHRNLRFPRRIAGMGTTPDHHQEV